MQIKYLVIIALFAVPSVPYAAGNEAGEYIGSAQAGIPLAPPPPPPPAPCPPPPPGVSIKTNCETPTLEELKNIYLRTEGHANRGLNFYYFASQLFTEHRLSRTISSAQSNYAIDTQTVFDGLGFPDYEKKKIIRNQTMDLYAYRFDYQSDKDYLLIVYTVNGAVFQAGYSETNLEIDDSWREFNWPEFN